MIRRCRSWVLSAVDVLEKSVSGEEGGGGSDLWTSSLVEN